MEAKNQMVGFPLLFVYSILFSVLNMTTALDTIHTSTSIRDGETLVSTGQSFELGFFSLTNSTTSRYLGLWYKKSPQTILWVANRGVPLSNDLSSLNVTTQGILVILNSTNDVVWSSNASKSNPQNPIAQLLETGNLVVREGNDNNPDNFLWQSFDYPCDNLLPGMKLGGNFATGLNWFLSSWKGTLDPAQGEFSFGIDLQGYPQLVLRRGPRILFRIGSWNGLYFTGFPGMKQDPYVTFEPVLNPNEVYFKFELKNSSVFARLILYTSGVVQGFSWSDGINDWTATSTSKVDQCENYAFCGENAYCDANSSPVCTCFYGFVPKSQIDWNIGNWTGGCVRRIPLNCSDQDWFQTYTGFKLPDTSHSLFDRSSSLMECKGLCLQNCSCFAYASLDIRGRGSGCLRWFGDLSDARTLADGEQDIYIRLAGSETAEIPKKRISSKKMHAGIIAGSVIVGTSILILGMVFCIRRRNLRKNDNGLDKEEDMELPLFDLSTIANATGNFSSSNKLGEGGFGPVYKGTLTEGQEIAVKRLSKSSRQGLNEFKNEVILFAKLQHRNLVKLLGCCIHEDEKMLIYEFMPNGSLDSFLFDPTRSKLLDWSKRMRIIGGIARGLLYLHQDSRLRIIHRDIKASNILLDSELNPKISDFGLARMFGGDQTEANIVRVVGTYGYMSPEYALDGLFSVKSDVFSFGVLILEILSGKKNRGFFQPDSDLNLLGHAWMLWVDGTPLDLMDKCLSESCTPSEALRCIHVALLCVQQRPEDRPHMSSVVLMLGSENALPQPKQPGFSMGRNAPEKDNSQNKHESVSANEVTVTLLEPR